MRDILTLSNRKCTHPKIVSYRLWPPAQSLGSFFIGKYTAKKEIII
jgi:hypothetical protein